MTLGQRIQANRTALNLSQEALGERLGVTRQAVSRWEADGAVPDTDKLIALSKLFGVSLNHLLQVEGPVQPEAPAQTQAPPTRKKRLWHILSALFLLALTLWAAVLWGRVSTLEAQVADLRSQQTASAGLDPSVPLVAAFDFALSSQSYLLQLDLTPLQLPEGLAVGFTAVSSEGISRTAQGSGGEGGHYTAELSLAGLYPPFTVTATLSDGVRQYAQALVKIESVRDNGYTWNSLWEP